MVMDPQTLELVLKTLDEVIKRALPLERRLQLDREEEFPEALVRELLGPNVGIPLVFLPEEQGGLGGGAADLCHLCETLASADLGVATSVLAVALGTDPIRVGGTADQRERWLSKIVQGLIVAYGVTEPGAGSHVEAIQTTAERVEEGGRVVAYRLSGTKQFMTNGAVADLYTILARTPRGPSFFIVEAGAPGLEIGRSEVKHGIRASNTAQVVLDGVEVPADHLVGGDEGRGLSQASEVFAYTRLMVGAMALGAGKTALRRAVDYARERVQLGSPLIDKPAFTHKLLVPHAARLAAAEAAIDVLCARLDGGEAARGLAVEGAIAKLFASEAANAAADAAIQAHGGYGYVHEYEVEKIRRDLRITTIYEGTSEILESLIAASRWRQVLRGGFLQEMERVCLSDDRLDSGGGALAAAARALSETARAIQERRLSRNPFVLLVFAQAMARLEVGVAFSATATTTVEKTLSRLFARQVCLVVAERCEAMAGRAAEVLADWIVPLVEAQVGGLADMDAAAAALKAGDLA